MAATAASSFEYLERLPGVTFRRLYEQPATALAVFRRMLPHLAKTIVMAMLYMPKPMPLADLDNWVKNSSRTQKGQALSVLSRLHIVTSAASSKEAPPSIHLTTNFARSLRMALTGGGPPGSFGMPTTNPSQDVNEAFLDGFATDQWENLLQYIVNSTNPASIMKQPKESVRALLEAGELVDMRGTKFEGIGITQAGFTFLLQEVNAQVWTILLLWLEHAEEMGMDNVDLLSFFFMLGSLEVGVGYSTLTLNESTKSILPILADFGLIYIPPGDHTTFYPTRLATTLTSDSSSLRSISSGFNSAIAATSAGFIVIETNYRLYAYTSSPLQIAVLSLFTKFSTRYPNMVSGRISRDSIRRAISHGITADQIISYLSTHAHPQMRKKPNILPPTVVDQIRLWQIENERMQATPGFLFKEFASKEEYDGVVGYAKEIGVLVWKSDKARCFFVTRHEQLRDYIKTRKMK